MRYFTFFASHLDVHFTLPVYLDSHQSHLRCSVVTCALWLPFWIAQTQKEMRICVQECPDMCGHHLEAGLLFCFAGKLFRSGKFYGTRVCFGSSLRLQDQDCDSHPRVFEEEGVHKGGASCLSPNTRQQCVIE